MMNRQIGTLSNIAPRTIGKFYQTQKLNTAIQPEGRENTHLRSNPIKTRTKSVGQIYNTKFSSQKQSSPQHSPLSGNFNSNINYNRFPHHTEIESKLSSHLECTLRANNRQKYNYLSSHYNTKYEILSGMNRAIQQKYGNWQPLTQLNNPQEKDRLVTVLKERKQSLPGQINVQKRDELKETIVRVDKPISLEYKQESKTLKNSRKIGNKQKNTILQFSSSENGNKQNIFPTYPTLSSKKQGGLGLIEINHEEHKRQLENKLKRVINSYQTKNKQLQNQLLKIQTKPNPDKKEPSPITTITQAQPSKQDSPIYKNQYLEKVLNELIDFNLKGINLYKQCDQKLQQIWKSIHHQIMSDQHLRIVKCFINQANINQILTILNQTRLKKIDLSVLKTHPDQYDPFLVQKIHQLLKNNNPDLTHKRTCKWISDQFAKSYEASEKNMLKALSQEKMECTIRTMTLEKEVKGLRRGEVKELTIRDFTRYMSTLFKANLRNRNVLQIFNKIKNMSYIGRFVELLQEKAGKGAELKRLPSANK